MTPQEFNAKIGEKAAYYANNNLPIPSNYDLAKIVEKENQDVNLPGLADSPPNAVPTTNQETT